MSDTIISDHPLNPAERALLGALLDTLLPASEDGALPSAADVDFDRYLRTQAADYVSDLQAALERFDAAFADAPLNERVERMQEFSQAEPERFMPLLSHVYDCYYQDDRVREAIGMIKGPVFPQGNEVTAGDLSLLDPVIANSDKHTYRRA